MVNLTYLNLMNEYSPKHHVKQAFKTVHGLPQSLHSSKSNFSLDGSDHEQGEVKHTTQIRNKAVKNIKDISEHSLEHFGVLNHKSKHGLNISSMK